MSVIVQECWHPVPTRKRNGAGAVTEECRPFPKQPEEECVFDTREDCVRGLHVQNDEIDRSLKCDICMEVKDTKFLFHPPDQQHVEEHKCCGPCLQMCLRNKVTKCAICREPLHTQNVSGAHMRALRLLRQVKPSFAFVTDPPPAFDDAVRKDIDDCNFASIELWLLRGGPKSPDFYVHAATTKNDKFWTWAEAHYFPAVHVENVAKLFGRFTLVDDEEIRLSGVSIPYARDLDKDLFPYKNLQKLSLTNAQLYFISFSKNVNLTYLDLSHNNIKEIDSQDFKSLRKLCTLNLSHNKLEKIPGYAFQYLESLTELLLNNNKLVSLNLYAFGYLSKLQTLTLSNNQIGNDTLKSGIFDNLSKLRTLNLSGNMLHSLSVGFFSGLTELELLDLGGNKIKELEPETFVCMTKLYTLMLENNEISVVHRRAFQGLIRLRTICLGSNHLTTLENGFPDTLEFLDVKYNEIHTIQADTFKNCRFLKEVNLRGNKLTLLPQGLFRSVPLQSLILTNNLFTSFENLGLPESLSTFKGNRNNVNTITAQTFRGLKHLKFLKLGASYTNIDERAFDSLTSLQTLYIPRLSVPPHLYQREGLEIFDAHDEDISTDEDNSEISDNSDEDDSDDSDEDDSDDS